MKRLGRSTTGENNARAGQFQGLNRWGGLAWGAALLAAGAFALDAGLPAGIELAQAFGDPRTGDAEALARARLLQVLSMGLAAACAGLAACAPASGRGAPAAAREPSRWIWADPALGGTGCAALAALLLARLEVPGAPTGREAALAAAGALAVAVAAERFLERRGWLRLAALALPLALVWAAWGARAPWARLSPGELLGAPRLGLGLVAPGFALGALLVGIGVSGGRLARGLLAGASVVAGGLLIGLGAASAALAQGRGARAAALGATALLCSLGLAARWAGPDALAPGLQALPLALCGLGADWTIRWGRARRGAERGVSSRADGL